MPKEADRSTKRRLAAATLVAFGAYATLAVAAVAVARGATVAPEKMLEVTFEKPLPKKAMEPPPPPPRPLEPKRVEKPKVAAPAPPAPPPPEPAAPPPVTPKAIPKEALPESEPVADKPAFIPPAEGVGQGSAHGVVGGVPGGTGTGPAVAAVATAAGPVNLPEEATPPVESADNRRPDYPESARAAGQEGLVILKIVVTELGRVSNIQVLKGEPPFVDAAIAAVKNYQYTPAFLAGRPIAVFRIVKIPFRLSAFGGQ